MEITTDELPNLVGKVLVVQVNVKDSSDEDYAEISGRCLVANIQGLVIQTRSRAEIVNMGDVIDIDIVKAKRRLIRRVVGDVDIDSVKQHLIDRHGMPYDMVSLMKPEDALTVHTAVNHKPLGHLHGERVLRVKKMEDD